MKVFDAITGKVYFKELFLYKQFQRALQKANTGEFKEDDFGRFNIYNENLCNARMKAIEYCRNFDLIKKSRENSIFFIGQAGSEKLNLAILIAQTLMRKNLHVAYMPYRNVIMKIKQIMSDDKYYHKEISGYQNTDVLFIDDLFKNKPDKKERNIMFDIISYRYQNFLPVIICTERTLAELTENDDALGSIIFDMTRKYLV